MEARNLEIRANIKIKFGWKFLLVIDSMHQVYGYSVPRTTVSRWIKLFKEGQDDFKDDPREGRPLTQTFEENVTAVQVLINYKSFFVFDRPTGPQQACC